MPVRLGIVLSHPTQYYSPWFRWVRANTAIEFRVFYLWEFGVAERRDPQFQTQFKWDVDLLSGYESEFVPNVSSDPGTHHFFGLRNPQITRRLQAWRPDALLLFGYKWSSHLRAIGWARWQGVPLLFRGDSHFLGRTAGSSVSRLALRIVYSQFAAFLTVGAANRVYFETLGVPARKMFFAPHSVDASLFDPERPPNQAKAGELRAQLGIADNATVVLFAGKLVPAKQPIPLLDAFLRCADDRAVLVFVGDGPEKPALMDRARTVPAGRVHFLPFANQTEMPARYLLADIFALPSGGLYETWGLAVNEAMHLGVPALVSDRVGCQQDLVHEGKTGWVFRVDEPDALTAALGRAIAAVRQPEHRVVFRANVRRQIAQYTYAQTTTGLENALAALAH